MESQCQPGFQIGCCSSGLCFSDTLYSLRSAHLDLPSGCEVSSVGIVTHFSAVCLVFTVFPYHGFLSFIWKLCGKNVHICDTNSDKTTVDKSHCFVLCQLRTSCLFWGEMGHFALCLQSRWVELPSAGVTSDFITWTIASACSPTGLSGSHYLAVCPCSSLKQSSAFCPICESKRSLSKVATKCKFFLKSN